MLFDGYVAVDWSASAKPVLGENSIWICKRGWWGTPEPENLSTRVEAVKCIDTLLTDATKEGRRVLCGFDFPFGYPEGTARKLTGRDCWAALWSLIAEVIQDGPRNDNKRFDKAAELNGHFCGEGPFWGNGLKRDIQGLPRKRPRSGWGQYLPPNRRYADRVVPTAQEVWKLSGVGSVGGQALTGIAALQGLRTRDDVLIWPFQTLGEGKCHHVLAEIYPSLIAPCPGPEVVDARQVKAVAMRLQELDTAGHLKCRLRAPKSMPESVRNEEGLFLEIRDMSCS